MGGEVPGLGVYWAPTLPCPVPWPRGPPALCSAVSDQGVCGAHLAPPLGGSLQSVGLPTTLRIAAHEFPFPQSCKEMGVSG